MAISKEQKLEVYRKNLARYEADGDNEKAAIQRRLIARIEAQPGGKKK
jgi:hypothetical protein